MYGKWCGYIDMKRTIDSNETGVCIFFIAALLQTWANGKGRSSSLSVCPVYIVIYTL